MRMVLPLLSRITVETRRVDVAAFFVWTVSMVLEFNSQIYLFPSRITLYIYSLTTLLNTFSFSLFFFCLACIARINSSLKRRERNCLQNTATRIIKCGFIKESRTRSVSPNVNPRALCLNYKLTEKERLCDTVLGRHEI